MTAKAKMTDLVLQVRVENGTKADGKAAVKNINFNQLKLDATDQQLLDAGHAAAGLQSHALQGLRRVVVMADGRRW